MVGGFFQVIAVLYCSSPRVCYFGRLFDSPPVGAEVVLGGGEVPVSREGSGHRRAYTRSRREVGEGSSRKLKVDESMGWSVRR
jgi:hypothetical protein